LMQREGRISDARTAYQKALKLDPKLSDARTALAELNKGGR